MRHQIKKKYSDQQEIDRKDHSQKEYRRTQKYKTGWRARCGFQTAIARRYYFH